MGATPMAVGGTFADIMAEMPTDATQPDPEYAAESGILEKLCVLGRLLAISPLHAKIISLVLVAAIVILCAFGRHTLAAHSPILSRIFAMLSVHHESPENQLDIQLTSAEKCLVAGRDMLCIEGTVSHKGHEPLNVPPVYVTALNVDGKEFTDAEGLPILRWTVTVETGKLLAGETRSFSLREPYPDQAITDFDYGFVDDAHESPH